MDDAGGVRVLQPAQDLADDRERARRRHRPRRDGRGQRLPARNSITRNSEPSGVRPKSVTVMMFGCVEPAGRLGLAFEAARELFLAAQLGQQHLDGEIAAHHRVLGAIHRAHAADADAADDAVAVTDDDADERIGDRASRSGSRTCPRAGPRPRSLAQLAIVSAPPIVRRQRGCGARRVAPPR